VQYRPISIPLDVLKFDDIAVISQIQIPRLADADSSPQASVSRSQSLAD
jgi:hypothetical protein